MNILVKENFNVLGNQFYYHCSCMTTKRRHSKLEELQFTDRMGLEKFHQILTENTEKMCRSSI